MLETPRPTDVDVTLWLGEDWPPRVDECAYRDIWGARPS
jgi:hypothetical protein